LACLQGEMGWLECLSRPIGGAPTNVHGRPFWQISFPRRSPERNHESGSTTSTEAQSGLRLSARQAIEPWSNGSRTRNSHAPFRWGPDPSSPGGLLLCSRRSPVRARLAHCGVSIRLWKLPSRSGSTGAALRYIAGRRRREARCCSGACRMRRLGSGERPPVQRHEPPSTAICAPIPVWRTT
jgi:hypothetical protein